MAAVPNQNDINDIIKSRVKSLNKTISIIIDAASSKTIIRAGKEIENLKKYQSIIETTLGKGGIFTTIMSAIPAVEKFSQLSSLKITGINKNLKSIATLTDYILNLKIDSEKAALLTDNLKPVLEMYTTVADILTKIDSLKTPVNVGIKLALVKRALRKIAKMGITLNLLNLMAPIMTTGLVSLSLLKTYTSMLADVFGSIESISVGPMMWIKIKLIPTMLRKMLKTISVLNEISLFIAATGGLKDSLILATVFNMVESVFNSINAIKIGILFNYKLKRINNALKSMRKIIITLNRIRIKPTLLAKILLLESMFIAMGTLFLSVILLTPAVILAIPALLILIVGVYVLKFATKIIVKIISKLVSGTVIKGLIFLIIVCAFYILLGATFLIIALIAKPVVKSILWILGFLGVVVLVTAAAIGIGMLIALALPYIAPALLGLGFIVIVVGILVLIALALLLLQVIALDPEIIKKNVRCVIDTALMVIEEIFRSDETEDEESDKSWIESIIDFIGGSLGTIIKAIMAAAFLAVMVVAILMILLIASQLKLIELLDLDPGKVKAGVRTVIDTAQLVIDTLFKSSDTEGTESKKSWIESVLDFLGSSLLSIIKAIMAVAFLATMVIAIMMIVLIAGELRVLQEINLKPELIGKNVAMVIATAQMIINNIFDPDDKDSKESKKSWIVTVLKHFGGALFDIITAIMAVVYLAFILISIVLITIIADQLTRLQELNLDAELIKSNVTIVIETAQMVANSLFDRDDKEDKPSSKTWLGSLLENFVEPLFCIYQAIMSIVFLALTIAVVALIIIIAEQLARLQDIKLDDAAILKNVELCCTVGQSVVDAIYSRNDKEDKSSDKSWIRTVIKWLGLGSLAQIVDAIMALAWLGWTIAIILMVKSIAETLEYIGQLKLSPDIKKNVNKILNAAEDVVSAVLDRPEPIRGNSDEKKGGLLRWMFPKLAEAADMISKLRWMSSVMSIAGTVHELAKTVLTLNDLPDVSHTKAKVTTLCKSVDSIIQLVTARPDVDTDNFDSRLNWMTKIKNHINSFNYINTSGINKAKRAMKAQVDLVKEINTIDYKKLETSAKMFEAMAKFSTNINGNFEKLAETINEDLMPVLEELKEIMGIIPEKLDVGFQNTSASIGAAAAPMTNASAEAQIRRENPADADEGFISRLVQRRMNEKAKADANGVASKLDELITLLKGYGGNKVIVKTI